MPQLLLAIASHRDAISQAQQQLELERQRTESQVTTQGQQTADAKAEAKRKQVADERTQKILAAHDLVANRLAGVTTQPGDISANIEAMRAEMLADSKNRQLAPFINDAVNSQKDDALKTLTDAANARIAAANAPVAEQTAASKIAKAKTEASRATQDLANSKVEGAIHKLQLADFGDAKARQSAEAFSALLSTGLDAGQAADFAHINLPASIPRDYMRAPKTGNAATAAAAKDMATTMRAAAENIKAAKSPALGLAGRISMNPADGIVSSLVQYGAIASTSPEQQGLASDYLMLTKAITHLTDGTKASNQDVDRMIRAIVPLAAESNDVVQKKLIMIDLLPTVFEANARGVSQAAALDGVIAAAKKRGVGQALLDPFISLRNSLKEAETNPAPSDTTSRNRQLLNEALGRR